MWGMWFDETKADLLSPQVQKVFGANRRTHGESREEATLGFGAQLEPGLLVTVEPFINQAILGRNLQISFRKMKLKRNFDLSASNKSRLRQKIKVLEWSRPGASQSVGRSEGSRAQEMPSVWQIWSSLSQRCQVKMFSADRLLPKKSERWITIKRRFSNVLVLKRG